MLFYAIQPQYKEWHPWCMLQDNILRKNVRKEVTLATVASLKITSSGRFITHTTDLLSAVVAISGVRIIQISCTQKKDRVTRRPHVAPHVALLRHAAVVALGVHFRSGSGGGSRYGGMGIPALVWKKLDPNLPSI